MRDDPPVSVLLGAGASVDAGVPATAQMVDNILETTANPKRVEQVLDFRYPTADEGYPSQSSKDDLLRRATLVRPYLQWVLDSDPLASTDIERLYSNLRLLSKFWNGPLLVPDVQFGEFHAYTADDTLVLVDYTIHRMLSPPTQVKSTRILHWPCARYLSGLDFLRRRFHQKTLEVFSLNYDVALEIALESMNINYTTCFTTTRESLGTLDPDLVGAYGQEVALYKLHGSHRWRQLGGEMVELPVHVYYEDIQRFLAGTGKDIEVTVETTSGEPPLVTSATEARYDLSPSQIANSLQLGSEPQKPAMVWADTNKLRSSNPHRLLYHRFCDHLLENGILLIIGYGWKDEGINRAIAECFRYEKRLRGLRGLVIVGPDPPVLEPTLSRAPLFAAIEEEATFAEISGHYLVISPMFVKWLRGTAKEGLEGAPMPVFSLSWKGDEGFDFAWQKTSTLQETVMEIRQPVKKFTETLQRILGSVDDG